jgi:ATP phosphoribosyltransferase
MADDDDGLILAVPSKGRLEEETRRVFGDSRLPITRPGGARSYSGAIKNQPGVAVRFYPAAEIARGLIMGAVDIGVTGSDLIYETAENGEGKVVMVKPLNFGQADVVVAVPDAWIDVTHMVDLADVASDFRLRHGRWLRVATKYVHLTRKFFSDWGIAEYRIVESAGATEAAPAAGAADLIVDITSSGATLQANALRVLEDGLVMKSEANLIISRTAQWTPLKKAQLEALLSIMGGVAPGISTQL